MLARLRTAADPRTFRRVLQPLVRDLARELDRIGRGDVAGVVERSIEGAVAPGAH